MLREHARLHEHAENLNLAIRIRGKGNTLEIEFKRVRDRELFCKDAWEPDGYEHTVQFADPQFIPFWTSEVHRVMAGFGLAPSTLIQEGDRVRFRSQDETTHAIFVMIERQEGFNGGCDADPAHLDQLLRQANEHERTSVPTPLGRGQSLG